MMSSTRHFREKEDWRTACSKSPGFGVRFCTQRNHLFPGCSLSAGPAGASAAPHAVANSTRPITTDGYKKPIFRVVTITCKRNRFQPPLDAGTWNEIHHSGGGAKYCLLETIASMHHAMVLETIFAPSGLRLEQFVQSGRFTSLLAVAGKLSVLKP